MLASAAIVHRHLVSPIPIPFLCLWLAGAAPQERPTTRAVAEKLEYPTFEIFRSSRMFPLLAGDLDKVDLARLAQGAEEKPGLEPLGVPARGDEAGRPSAELTPRLPAPERLLWTLVPVVMMKLEPLWKAATWTEAQVALANHGAGLVRRLPGAPALVFEHGRDAANRANLEMLVRWFRTAAARHERLAAMIFTMDDGPFVGLPYEATIALASTETRRLGERVELRLARVERHGEKAILQCLVDGKPSWSRVVSGAPTGTVAQAEFAGKEPKRLGSYGWHVPFTVNWSYGHEQAHLYVGADGALLFYFLSW